MRPEYGWFLFVVAIGQGLLVASLRARLHRLARDRDALEQALDATSWLRRAGTNSTDPVIRSAATHTADELAAALTHRPHPRPETHR